MAKLSHLTSAAARIVGYMCLTKSTLAIGTVATGYNTTGTSTYLSDGVLKTFAAQTSKALAVISGHQDAFYVQPAGKTVYYVLAINAAGTFGAVQGSYAGQPLAHGGVGAGGIPDVPDGWTPFGIIKVTTDGSTTFTVGTTAFNATGVTSTFTDVAMLPAANSL